MDAMRSSAGEVDDELVQFPRTIKRQEVPTIFDRYRLGAGKQALIMLALVGSRPILLAPDQTNRNVDVPIGRGSGLPAHGIAQQVDERSVMTAPVADFIHFLEEFGRDAVRICNAAPQNGLHDNEVSKPHDRLP